MMMWEQFFWSELRVTLTALERCALPVWKGSLLRGALGRRLQRASLVLAGGGSLDRDSGSDLYRELWESKTGERGNAPKPMVLLPPECREDYRTSFRPGDRIEYGIRLLGKIGRWTGDIRDAVSGNWELGHPRSPWQVSGIHLFNGDKDSQGWFPAKSCVASLPIVKAREVVHLQPWQDHGAIRFLVPVDFKLQGQRVDLVDGPILMQRLIERLYDVVTAFCDGADREEFLTLRTFANEVQTGRTRWSRQNWERYSSTTDRKHPLTGIMGTLELCNIPQMLWPYLVLGQYLHLGKGASFGQGAYRLLNDFQ